MRTLKQGIKRFVHRLGYDVTRYRPPVLGVNVFSDLQRLLEPVPRPVVFDVGANVGQTTREFKERMPRCQVHAFEPSASTYQQLIGNTRGLREVHLNNVAVGARAERRLFLEYTDSVMSSFLEPGEACWSAIAGRTMVPVVTLDEYCARMKVPRIDVLKSDTQGYDLEVLKGARALLAGNAVHWIYMEITFSDLYRNLPPFDQIYRFLADNRFQLVSFYQFFYENDVASWSDALFVNPQYGVEGGTPAARGARVAASDSAPRACLSQLDTIP